MNLAAAVTAMMKNADEGTRKDGQERKKRGEPAKNVVSSVVEKERSNSRAMKKGCPRLRTSTVWSVVNNEETAVAAEMMVEKSVLYVRTNRVVHLVVVARSLVETETEIVTIVTAILGTVLVFEVKSPMFPPARVGDTGIVEPVKILAFER